MAGSSNSNRDNGEDGWASAVDAILGREGEMGAGPNTKNSKISRKKHIKKHVQSANAGLLEEQNEDKSSSNHTDHSEHEQQADENCKNSKGPLPALRSPQEEQLYANQQFRESLLATDTDEHEQPKEDEIGRTSSLARKASTSASVVTDPVPRRSNANTIQRKRGHRRSIDGTRHFRKVVIFRSSLVQIREFGPWRRRGRNSFLPWKSKAHEAHSAQVLEEQRLKEEETQQEQKAKKAQKKAEKQAEKGRKRDQKKADRLTKKEKKREQKKKKEGLAVLSSSSSADKIDVILDHSAPTLEGSSGPMINAKQQSDPSSPRTIDHTRRRRRRRSSMLWESIEKLKASRPARTVRSKRDQRQENDTNAIAADNGVKYDWRTHLSQPEMTPHGGRDTIHSTRNNDYPKTIQEEEEEEEEDAFDQEWQALPKEEGKEYEQSILLQNHNKADHSSLNNSMDISGVSFAGVGDPTSPLPPRQQQQQQQQQATRSTNHRRSSLLARVFGGAGGAPNSNTSQKGSGGPLESFSSATNTTTTTTTTTRSNHKPRRQRVSWLKALSEFGPHHH